VGVGVAPKLVKLGIGHPDFVNVSPLNGFKMHYHVVLIILQLKVVLKG